MCEDELVIHEHSHHCENEAEQDRAGTDGKRDEGLLLLAVLVSDNELALNTGECKYSHCRSDNAGKDKEHGSHPPLGGHAVVGYPRDSALVAGSCQRLVGVVGLYDPYESQDDSHQVNDSGRAAECEVVEHCPLALAYIENAADKSHADEKHQDDTLSDPGVAAYPADDDGPVAALKGDAAVSCERKIGEYDYSSHAEECKTADYGALDHRRTVSL